ncbi:uncharacterized protein LOC110261347 isoform X2 [Sus scrofa]|nr:uncharacterized protein LOC110261347 isoform X2 [Sus scrofa]
MRSSNRAVPLGRPRLPTLSGLAGPCTPRPGPGVSRDLLTLFSLTREPRTGGPREEGDQEPCSRDKKHLTEAMCGLESSEQPGFYLPAPIPEGESSLARTPGPVSGDLEHTSHCCPRTPGQWGHRG